MMTRKEFLEQVMKMANLKDLKQADDAARAVISLTKLIIGPKLSEKIAKVSPPDLREGWESIKSAFPRQPIKIITGSGGEDLDMRRIAPIAQKYLGVGVMVENIVGFRGKMAFEKFQATEPDGYTLMSYTFPRSIIIEQMPGANFRTIDFTPIFSWSTASQLLVVSPDRFVTFDDFLNEAKRKVLRCAIPIRGGISHLAGLILAEGLGIDVDWISCEGSASSIAALSRREADFTICLSTVLPSLVSARKVKPLVSLPNRQRKRCPYFPDVPAITEFGYEMEFITVRHVLEAPPKTPFQIAKVLEAAFAKAAKDPAYTKWARKNCIEIVLLSGEEISEEIARAYSKIEKFRSMFAER